MFSLIGSEWPIALCKKKHSSFLLVHDSIFAFTLIPFDKCVKHIRVLSIVTWTNNKFYFLFFFQFFETCLHKTFSDWIWLMKKADFQGKQTKKFFFKRFNFCDDLRIFEIRVVKWNIYMKTESVCYVCLYRQFGNNDPLIESNNLMCYDFNSLFRSLLILSNKRNVIASTEEKLLTFFFFDFISVFSSIPLCNVNVTECLFV